MRKVVGLLQLLDSPSTSCLGQRSASRRCEPRCKRGVAIPGPNSLTEIASSLHSSQRQKGRIASSSRLVGTSRNDKGQSASQ